MCTYDLTDRIPNLVGSYPDFVRESREIVSRDSSIRWRSYKVLSLCHSFGLPKDHMSAKALMSPKQHKLVSGSPAKYRRDEEAVRLLLELNDYIEGLGGKSLINIPYCTVGKGESYYGMALRRSIEALAAAKSWRWTPPKPVEVSSEFVRTAKLLKKKQKHVKPEIRETLDCKGRFAVLAHSLYGTDVESDDWVEMSEEDLKPPPQVSVEDRRLFTQAEVNKTRVKMGYAPKGAARVDSDEYRRIERAAKRDVLQGKLWAPPGRGATPAGLMIKARVSIIRLRDLKQKAATGKFEKNLRLFEDLLEAEACTLIGLWTAFERFHAEWCELGGPDLVPGLDPFRTEKEEWDSIQDDMD